MQHLTRYYLRIGTTSTESHFNTSSHSTVLRIFPRGKHISFHMAVYNREATVVWPFHTLHHLTVMCVSNTL